MSLIRKSAIRFGNLIPQRWKRSLKWELSIPDAGASLELLRRRGFQPRRALDIGAYHGTWSRMCKDIWPNLRICMFEAQPEKAPGLQALTRSLSGLELRMALLSDLPDQEVAFHLAESGSSSLTMLSNPDAPTTRLRTQTLSQLVKGTEFERPDFIKVDVQGAELQVLDGGQDVLAAAQVVMLEVSVIEEYVQGPLFADVIAYMADRGLLVHDICTIFRHTPSRAMNEVDVIFARRDSVLNASRRPASQD
ncbi:MAG: FkbM family methyltransferase [Steroidobacteraceae bacterium]